VLFFALHISRAQLCFLAAYLLSSINEEGWR